MKRDPIRGIKLILQENPLNTKVELTEEGVREFTYRVALHEMENLVYEAYFHSDAERPSLFRPEQAVKELQAFVDWKDTTDDLPENSFEIWRSWASRHDRLDHFLGYLNEEHGGDCTAFACTCMRCWAESIAGICTHPWSKGVGSRISAMFRKPRNPELADEWREKNKATWEKYKAENPEAYAAHEVRWAQEAKETEAIMEEHRRKLAEQNK